MGGACQDAYFTSQYVHFAKFRLMHKIYPADSEKFSDKSPILTESQKQCYCGLSCGEGIILITIGEEEVT